MCMCVCACVRACVHVCVQAHMWLYLTEYSSINFLLFILRYTFFYFQKDEKSCLKIILLLFKFLLLHSEIK